MEDELEVADLNRVASAEGRDPREPLAGDQRPVLAAEILNRDAIAVDHDAGMAARNDQGIDWHRHIRVAADDVLAFGEAEFMSASRQRRQRRNAFAVADGRSGREGV